MILNLIQRPNYDDRYRPTQPWERPTTTPPPTRRPLGAISVRINSPRNRFQLNSQISLPCTVNSYSQPNVYWSKDGRRLSDSRKTQVRNVCFYGMKIRNNVLRFHLILYILELKLCFEIENINQLAAIMIMMKIFF